MDINTVQTSFSPAKEIANPDFFVGRTEEIKAAILAIPRNGSFIAIHGLRGVGKSSVVQQIKQIAEGNMALPNLLKITKFISIKHFNFLTLYVSCDDYTKTVNDIVKRLIFGDNDSGGLLELTKHGSRKIESIKETFKAGGSVGLFGIKLEGSDDKEVNYRTIFTDDLIQQFKQLIRTVQKDNQDKSGLLIFIDEFDIVKNKEGFGSLIKTISNDYVKFVVCGIANTITELIESHASIGRQLKTIQINKMPKEELYGILKRAEHHMSNNIYFSEDAAHEIVDSAEGFPYFVHLLGEECVLRAFTLDQKIISKEDVVIIKKEISDGKLKTIYEEVYHSSVKESSQKELLLKLLSEAEADEIFIVPICKFIIDLNLQNPLPLLQELTLSEDNSLGVLTKIRENYYRFTDPVFKVYARLRTWKFGIN